MGSKQRCQGQRRAWRRGVLSTGKCGRVARFTFQTYVGLTRTHYVCADNECMGSLTHGYRAMNVREL